MNKLHNPRIKHFLVTCKFIKKGKKGHYHEKKDIYFKNGV